MAIMIIQGVMGDATGGGGGGGHEGIIIPARFGIE
jgi:hypothetical protein